MRNLADVIDKMLEIIPDDHEIVPILKDNKSSAEFAAPEMMGHWWGEVANNLQEYLGEPNVKWKETVSLIYNDKEVPTMANNDDDKATEATICVRCKHKLNGTGFSPPIPHCNFSRPINYVTGTREPVPCTLRNPKGQCADYEERGDDE